MPFSARVLRASRANAHSENKDEAALPVHRPAVLETTALGAAYLAGLAKGFWSSVDELKKHRAADVVFSPKADTKQMERLQENWREAVARSRGWSKES